MTSFYMQIVASGLMYIYGRYNPLLLAFFFIFDSTIPAAVFTLFNILVSDIIDDDQKTHARKYPQSSMVFGTNALITKPGNSLAPMLVVAILNSNNYQSLKDSPENQTNPEQLNELKDVMFSLLCLIPLFLSLFQIIIWKFYKLRNSKAIIAKHVEV